MNQCWRVQSASPQSDAGAIVLEFQNGHSKFYQRFSSLTVVGSKEGGEEERREVGVERGLGKSSTDCLSIAADGVPKPTTGANIIASNIIHYRCQRCLPAGCLRPALSTLDYTPPLPPPVSPTALPPFTLCLANSLPPCCKLVTLQQILLVLSLAASSCAASLLPSSSVALASSRRSQ